MRKSYLLFIIFLSCAAFIFADDKDFESFRGCKDCRISDGKCNVVIAFLRASQCNDSIAIDIFRKEYEIVNMRYYEKEWLLRKNHIEIIRIFTLEENKKYYCRSKRFKPFDPVLLVE
jgi:hypothetical protein